MVQGITPEELHNIYAAEERFWWYRGMRAITEAFLEQAPAMRVGRALEAGCGTGYNALELGRRFGCRVYGIDLEPLALAYGRQRKFTTAARASILALPFPDASFDLVSCFDVLPHLPRGEEGEALREFARVLRPGGWLLLRAAAFDALRSRHSQYVGERQRFRAGPLRRALAASGLRPLRWSYVNSILSPVAFLKFRLWEPLRGAPPQSGVAILPPRWLNALLHGVLRCEAAWIRRGLRFPFGQSLLVLAQKPNSSQNG